MPQARAASGQGTALVLLGESNTGEEILRITQSRYCQFFEADHPEVLKTNLALAIAVRDQGDFGQGEEILRNVVAIQRENGPGPNLGRSLAELGIIKYRQDDLLEARELLGEALPMLRESMGDDNSYVAEILGKQVAVLGRVGDNKGAENAILKILEILPEGHPGIGTALHNLAIIQSRDGDIAKADETARQALKLQRANFGDQHANVAINLCLLGEIALRSDDIAVALARYESCFQTARSANVESLISLARKGLEDSRSATMD